MAQIKILYEDNHVIVAVKPQGILSQADSTGDEDILSYIQSYIKDKYSKPGRAYIGLVHRLDRPTGGIMIFARTSKAAKRLQQQLKSGKFEKSYMTVVQGHIPDHGVMENYLLKNIKTNHVSIVSADCPGAKNARLSYTKIQELNNLTLAEVKLDTGRTHQIRVQFAGIGTPVYGDVKYGHTKGALALWAYRLSFFHPVTKELMTFSEMPPDMFPWNIFEMEGID